MKITQRTFTLKASYRFDNDRFMYSFKDDTGSISKPIKYQSLPQIDDYLPEIATFNMSFFALSLPSFIAGAIDFQRGNISAGSLWVVFACVCCFLSYINKSRYTSLEAGGVSMMILAGKNHDNILAELENRRKIAYLAEYGEIDTGKDINDEILKYQWLQEIGVLNSKESMDMIEKVNLVFSENSGVAQ